MNIDTEPIPDVSTKPNSNEEIIDRSVPEGNTERVIIKRHPFGIIVLFFEAIFGMGVAFVMLYLLIPTLLSGDSKDQALRFLLLAGVVLAALVAVFLVLANSIYRSNRWIVTDDSISQISQTGLFRRQTSELSMANIEDVTAEQNGLLAELFGFGVLKVETAGERSNFYFIYCPSPNKYARIILHARELYIENEPQIAKRANEILNVPRTQV